MDEIIKRNNELIKQALENIKPIKAKLEKDLLDNPTQEQFNKLVALNKEILKAERLVDITPEDNKQNYAKEYPENVDTDGNLNDKGITRLTFLERKWGFRTFFKK